MVDINALRQLLQETSSGQFAYLNKEITVIKLLDVDPLFYKYHSHFYNNNVTLCRKVAKHDELCVGCAVSGATLRKRFLFYAYELLAAEEGEVRLFCVPGGVMQEITSLLLSDDWKGLCERESELVAIKKSGQGLNTRYKVNVTKKKFKHGMSDNELKSLVFKVELPTLEEQCEKLGLGEMSNDIVKKLKAGHKIKVDDDVPF